MLLAKVLLFASILQALNLALRPAAKVDLNRSLKQNAACTDEDLFNTILPNQRVYDLTVNRLFLGIEALAAHGFDFKYLQEAETSKGESYEDQFMQELAGNSFVGAVYAAVLIGVLTEMPPGAFPSAPPVTIESDEVLSILGI